MREIELPTADVRHWLAGAAQECGYPAHIADVFGYLAWWLENRGIRGVLRVTMYLLSIRNTPIEHVMPRYEDGKLICICPVTCGLLMAEKYGKDGGAGEWLGGFATADPVLMAAALTSGLNCTRDVFLRFLDLEVMFTKEGSRVLAENITFFALADTENGIDSFVRLIDPAQNEVRPAVRYEKGETLKVPKVRYLEGGGFLFD